MRWNHLTLGLLFLLVFALASCRVSAGELTIPPSTTGESGAEPAAAWALSEGRWESYTTDDGLPSNRIHALVVDPDRHLWVATDHGAGRFDGVTWESIVPHLESAVYDMAVDEEGCVWLLDSRGLEVYDRGTLTIHTTREELGNPSSTEAILIDSQDRIWVGGHWCGRPDEGIGLLDGGQWRYFNTTDGLFGTMVYDLVEDAFGTIWAVGELGLARFDGTTWESIRLPGQPVSQVINCVAVDPSGRVWFGARRSGVWIWDGEAWSQYTSADGLAGDTVWAIAFDGAGRVWLGTNGGLSVFDGETWTTYTAEDGLVHNDVRALAIVEDGVWVGTWKGLSHLVFDGGSP